MKSELLTMRRRALSGHYLSHGDTYDADCVIALSFGASAVPGYAGLVNVQLARFIRENCAGLPRAAQFEVDDALRQLGEGPSGLRISAHRKPGHYLNAAEVLLQARDWMDAHDYIRAVLVAQAYLMPRADFDARRFIIVSIVPPGLPRDFDPASTQPWTQSEAAWCRRERWSPLYYLFHRRAPNLFE